MSSSEIYYEMRLSLLIYAEFDADLNGGQFLLSSNPVKKF